MDTRHKIIPASAVPPGCTIVTGYFDPLLAGDARALANLPRPIAAVVLPLDNALLQQRARAELVAALRIIDYVVIADGWNQPDIHLEADQTRRVRELKEHVRRRQAH